MGPGPMHSGLERAGHELGRRVAVRSPDRAWSFAELDQWADALAGHLAAAGVYPGARVALLMANRVEFVVAVHAVSKIGAATVLVSPAWKAAEVNAALALTEPVHGLTDTEGLSLLAASLGRGRVTDVDDPVIATLAGGGPAPPRREVAPEREAVLVFSSGTTGLPKAVRHTHESIGYAISHWTCSLGLSAEDRFQIATPPSHILGLLNVLVAMRAGVTVRLHRRFDLDEVLRCIEADRMTIEMAVAPIALAMANHPHLEEFDLSSLRYIMWGATPVTKHVALVVTARTGVRWMPAYGTSEVPVIAANPVDRPDEWRLDSAGLAPSGVDLRVVDIDTGVTLAAGGVGEIQVRSRSCMAGYLPDSATADSVVDGWYHTGDVGYLEPGGWVHVTDRLKEMIKVNGFQVAPAEIEAVLLEHPSVLDCAVFGIADERAGEVPVAAVRLDPGRSVDGEELQQLVADTLATYKQLRHVIVVDAVPRSPSGKALRRSLRDQWGPVLLGAPAEA